MTDNGNTVKVFFDVVISTLATPGYFWSLECRILLMWPMGSRSPMRAYFRATHNLETNFSLKKFSIGFLSQID